MIFYGTRASNLKNGKIPRVNCPNCSTETSMTYSVFGKYAHIYWIPLFPYKKMTFAECDHCKKTFEQKELPLDIQNKLNTEKEKNPAKTPIWHFSLLIVILVLIAFAIYSGKQNEKDEKSYLENPKVGDKYEYKSTDGYYSIMKISEIKADSVYFLLNEMETNKMSGINDLDKPSNYKETEGFTKAELIALYEEGKIYEINR